MSPFMVSSDFVCYRSTTTYDFSDWRGVAAIAESDVATSGSSDINWYGALIMNEHDSDIDSATSYYHVRFAFLRFNSVFDDTDEKARIFNLYDYYPYGFDCVFKSD
jgi:hypothetical protein